MVWGKSLGLRMSKEREGSLLHSTHMAHRGFGGRRQGAQGGAPSCCASVATTLPGGKT